MPPGRSGSVRAVCVVTMRRPSLYTDTVPFSAASQVTATWCQRSVRLTTLTSCRTPAIFLLKKVVHPR